MNVKLLTKDFLKEKGDEQLGELDDKTKIVSFIKLPKSVNDYMGDKGQTKHFKFSSVDTDIFADKSGATGHFTFKFNQPKGMKAIDNFYDEMLPPVDYSGEIPEYYKYKLNKGKTINDRIADKLRENALDEDALDEDATRLPEAQELYPQLKTKKGEAFDRFKSQFEKYNSEKIPTTTIEESKEGGEEPPPEIEIKPVKKYSKPSAEERQRILRAEKMDKLGNEIHKIQSTEKIQKVFRGHKARRETEQMKNEIIQNEQAKENTTNEKPKGTKNQTGKGMPIKRIKKGSLKGNKVHREAEKMIKEITSIKNNLDQKLSASELKDNESNEDIVDENESAKRIQKIARGNIARQEMKNKNESAKTIQKIARGNIARQVMKNKNESAENIQKVFRGHQARQVMKNKNESAENIQKVFRGHQARQVMKNKNESAENIQKVFRGHQVRKQPVNNKKPPSELPITNNEEVDDKNKGNEIIQEKANQQESPAPVEGHENDDLEEQNEEEETPKKTPQRIKEEWLKKFEDADIAQRKFSRTMEYAYELEKEIEELSKEKNFKNMKADKDTMNKYNALKEGDIINVKPSIGGRAVKLTTILKNIKKSANLKSLRRKQDEEDKKRNEERKKDKDVRFGAPKTKIQTFGSTARGGGGGAESTIEASKIKTSKR